MSSDPLPRVALETSVRAASVAVECGHGTRSLALEAERAHASDLLPSLSALLDGETRPRDLQLVAVGTGPGSYTGLRVGIATALGLAEATGAKLIGIPSVEALAFANLRPGETGSIVLDARGGELYFACYQRETGDITTLQEPAAISPSDLAERLPDRGYVFADAGLLESGPLSEIPPERLMTGRVPHAEAVLQLGLQRFLSRGPQTMDEIRPLYLRPFAVRARKR